MRDYMIALIMRSCYYGAMKTIHIVRTFWDAEAEVWCAEGVNFMGLSTEAPTVDALIGKLPAMIADLEEANNEVETANIPLQLLIEASTFAQFNGNA